MVNLPYAAVSPVNVYHLCTQCPRLKAIAQIRVASATNHIEPWPAALNLHPVTFARAVCSQFQKPNKSNAFFFSIPAQKSLPTEKSICWPQTDQRVNYGAQAKMYVYANHAVITEADQLVFSPWLKGTRPHLRAASTGLCQLVFINKSCHTSPTLVTAADGSIQRRRTLVNFHPNSDPGFLELKKTCVMVHGASGGSSTSSLCSVETLYILLTQQSAAKSENCSP